MTRPPSTAPHSAPPTLVRLAAAAVVPGAVQKGRLPLPSSLVICPWGENKDLSGAPVIVNEHTVSQLAANQARYGFDEVALDFSHNTVPPVDAEGKPLKSPEPLPIAAMGTLSVEVGKGIIFTPTSWTPEGEHYYCGRHYKDLSPTVGKNEKGEVDFIHSVALTRAGQVSGLHSFAAGGLPVLTNLQTTSTPLMEDTTTDYKALLLQKLGIDAAATDEQILAAFNVPPAAPAAPLAAPAVPANVIPLDASAQISALSAEFEAMKKSNLIAEATRAGKVISLSAESVKLTPLSAIQELVDSTPVTVPLAATTPATPALPALKALSAEDEAVRLRMGYTLEQWREANPA